jgi:hypothetical protein
VFFWRELSNGFQFDINRRGVYPSISVVVVSVVVDSVLVDTVVADSDGGGRVGSAPDNSMPLYSLLYEALFSVTSCCDGFRSTTESHVVSRQAIHFASRQPASCQPAVSQLDLIQPTSAAKPTSPPAANHL